MIKSNYKLTVADRSAIVAGFPLRPAAVLAKEFGVSRQTIYNVWDAAGRKAGPARPSAGPPPGAWEGCVYSHVIGVERVKAIWAAAQTARNRTAVADEFAVSSHMVKRIWSGDAWRKRGYTRRKPPPGQKLRPDQARAIWESYGTETAWRLAATYGVSQASITHIWRGRNWGFGRHPGLDATKQRAA